VRAPEDGPARGEPGRRGRALDRLLLDAVGKALGGDWQAAHAIVQEHEADALAAWIHAVVHRMEGDPANARYWYRRCGRPFRDEVTPEVELREIQAALLG
jgi:hypothetical protein